MVYRSILEDMENKMLSTYLIHYRRWLREKGMGTGKFPLCISFQRTEYRKELSKDYFLSSLIHMFMTFPCLCRNNEHLKEKERGISWSLLKASWHCMIWTLITIVVYLLKWEAMKLGFSIGYVYTFSNTFDLTHW